MEFNIETVLLGTTLLLTGLTAGLCFTWTNAVTPGIGQMDDFGFLYAFQQMNRVIVSPTFILVFFGPFVLNIALIYLKYQNADKSFWFLVVATMLFTLGVTFVTVFKNVPLNEMLDRTDLTASTSEELKALRQKFETPWKQWHLVRTLSAIASFVMLLVGLILNTQSS